MRDIPVSGLDSLRISEGAEKCIAVFTGVCRRGVRAAAPLLNGVRTYPTFFLLVPQIEKFRLHPFLGPLKRAAYAITDQILRSADRGLLSEKNGAEHSALRWMLETGYKESLGGEYDAVLDVAASVMIGLYRDKDVLPLVADMIFARCREGRNIHDLAWAFFRSRDPETLRLAAERMDSEEDSKLAYSLLGIEDISVMAGGGQNGDFLTWLEENEEYLYFTDESFQFRSNPQVYGVDLERKYLDRGTPSYTRQPVIPVDSSEGRILAAFRQLKDDEQSALSEYSHKIRGDTAKWSKWMALPVGEQLREARQSRGDVWL
jgi:hypothetical protein